LLHEVVVDAEVDVDRLQLIGGEAVGVAVRAAVEPLDEGVVALLAGLGGGSDVGAALSAGPDASGAPGAAATATAGRQPIGLAREPEALELLAPD
jgi:hypothetical protein